MIAKRSFPKVVVVGRKRKIGPRHPCGKLEQERALDPKVVALRMPHRAEVDPEIRHDPRAETQIGRYLLCKRIENAEYEAGVWYRKTVNRYRRVIDAPNPSPPSLSLANSGVEPNNDPLPPMTFDARSPADIYQEAKHLYDKAFELLDEIGHRPAKWVARVAVHDEACPVECFGYMRLGLVALAVHRGLLTKSIGLELSRKIRKSLSEI